MSIAEAIDSLPRPTKEAALRSARRLRYGVLAMGAALVFGIAATLVIELSLQRRGTLRQAERDISNLVIAFDEQLSRTLDGVDQGMSVLANQFAKSPERFDLNQWLHDVPFTKALVIQVALTDANGTLIASSLGSVTTV